MRIIVQKFGGTSVADADRLRHVAKRVVQTQLAGYAPVVVVSAQGGYTDQLMAKAMEITDKPSARELDMLLATGEQASMALLAMAIGSLGHEAVSLTGAQGGILTDEHHGQAKITNIEPNRIRDELGKGRIVIVAGFQGINPLQEITTLGRGGSDTTAVALAAAVGAEACEIYTDVDGVFSSDPRKVNRARLLPEVSYDEMLEMASLGARVLHLRSVEIAKKHGVILHVRSSFHEGTGTLVKEAAQMEKGRVVTGVAHDTQIGKLTLMGVPDTPGVAAQIFTKLAENNVNVDMIVQSASRDGVNDISLTVKKDDFSVGQKILTEIAESIEAQGVEADTGVGKISIVGAGMISYPGVAARFFQVISDLGVNIEMISTSDISVSCIVSQDALDQVIRAVHEELVEKDAANA